MSFAGKFDGILPDSVGPHPHGHGHVETVSTHAPAGAIVVPDAHLLFTGDFKRSGVDLILSGDDRELVLHDYFKGEKRAALASPDGAHLTGDIVSALSGYTQFAQADGSPSVAQVIGHVTKLTGTATVIRNGVSIILNQGDNVNKGDVVQSGSNSSLGITFIDGSVFGLASNAKMVLNEMIYDPNGSNNSSLISLVQGTISFVAGATAKHGDMKVDTPVATMGIRGTAVLVEIDFDVPSQGGAPPAKFQVLVEPDGTTGSYILFDKTTLTPIATVNQAGTQTIVNGQGTVSFLSSAQLSADAQRVITDVFAQKFTDNTNPNTKTTVNFTDTIVPQTTFVKLASGETVTVTVQVGSVADDSDTSGGTGPTSSHQHISEAPTVVTFNAAFTERDNGTHSITHSSEIDTVSGKISFADINPGDSPTAKATFDSFKYENAQHSDITGLLTAEQLAAIQAVEIPLVVLQDPGNTNIGTATWTYSIADSAFDFLADGETLTLTYMAEVDSNYAPNDLKTFKTFTITITGTNDAPTIATSGGAITERIGTGNTAIDTASGTVTFTDVDLTDRPVVRAALSSSHPFQYLDAQGHDVTGSLTPEQLAAILAVEVPLSVVQAGGNGHNGSATWTYSIADRAFDFLAKGETLTLNYIATVYDGHGGVVSTPISVSISGADISVTGTNDVPTIVAGSTTATGAMTEDAAATLAAAGTITFQDKDLTDTHTAGFVLKSSDANANLPGYSEAAPLSQIGTFALGAVNEQPGVSTLGSVGWSFTLPDNDPVLQSLAVGQTITQVYTVTFNDHQGGTVSQDVTVVITGTNDAPVITSDAAAASGAVTEDARTPALSTSGTLQIQDLDLIDTHTAAFTFKSSASTAHLPGFTEGTDTIGTFTIDPSVTEDVTNTDNHATLGWSFALPDSDPVLQSLAVGQTITQVYTVTFDDHHGGTVSQDVTVVITGTNDKPVITSDVAAASGTVTEDASTPNLSTSGTLQIQDLDLIDTHTAASVFKSSASNAHLPGFSEGSSHIGTFTIDPSVTEDATDTDNHATLGWSFTLPDNDPVLQSLAVGQTITQVYTVTFDDHHGGTVSQDVTVVITGTNDAPVAVADSDVGHIVESGNDSNDNLVAGVPTTSGNVLSNDTDVDLIDTHDVVGVVAGTASGVLTGQVGATINGTYGWLVLDANGSWTYTLDNSRAATDALAQGAHVNDIFSYTESDHHGGTSTTTLTIDVAGTNDAPVANAAPFAVTDVNEGAPVVEQGVHSGDTPLAGVASATGNVLSNDFDVDTGDSKTVQGVAHGTSSVPLTGSVATAVDGTYGSVIIAADGTWTYTLDNGRTATQGLTEGEHVSDVFTYTMHDAQGATATATLTIDITGTNDAPTLGAVDAGTLTDTAANDSFGTLTGTMVGTDLDLNETSTLSYATLVSANHAVTTPVAGLYGSLTVNADGTYSYVADASAINALHAGTYADTFTVQTTDVHGATGTATLTVNVNGANDAPTLAAVDAGTLADTAANDSFGTFTGTMVGTDLDLNETSTLSYATLVSANHAVTTAVAGLYGSLTVNADGTYSYVADAGAINALHAGTYADTFTVQTTDVHGATGTATLTVNVNGADDAPITTDDAASIVGNTGFVSGHLLANDSDAEHDGLSISNVVHDFAAPDRFIVDGTYGELIVIKSTGDYTYTLGVTPEEAAAVAALADGVRGQDDFTYTAFDGMLGTDGHLTVTVTGADEAPSIVSGTNPPAQAVMVVYPAAPVVLAEGVNTNSLDLPTETFDGGSVGSSSNNGAGHGNFHSAALDATFSGSGNAGIVNGSSSVTAAPFVGPSPGSRDTTDYLSIGGGGAETITFASEKNAFGLYWGSVDSFNSIKFYHGTTLVASYTGADISPLFPTGNQGSFTSNGYVEFAGLQSFDRVVLGSDTNAFEIDNISAGSVQPTHAGLAAPITGTLSIHDADIGDTLTASVFGNASIEYNGSTALPGGVNVAALVNASAMTFDSAQSDGGTDVLHWSYHPAGADLDFLHAGDVLKIEFTAEVSDGHGNFGSQPLAVTLVGANNTTNVSAFSTVNGTSGNDTFSNVGGNVTIFGGNGQDTFVFNPGFGKATIADFDVNNDKIEISKTLFGSVGEVLAAAAPANSGHDVVITDAAHDTITLKGLTVAQLQAFDFHLF